MFVCVKDKSGEFGWKIQSARERKDKATRLILLKYVVERSTLTKFMFERTSTLRKQMIEGTSTHYCRIHKICLGQGNMRF